MDKSITHRIFPILFILLIVSSCSPAIKYSSHKKGTSFANKTGKILYGKASYYADFFEGRLTANGEIFDQSKLTAAHKTLPFGTLVRVTNLGNNKSVVVIINDRGPFVAGRIIDLSKKAAQEINMIKEGVVDIELEILN